jgi:hypothetical protein
MGNFGRLNKTRYKMKKMQSLIITALICATLSACQNSAPTKDVEETAATFDAVTAELTTTTPETTELVYEGAEYFIPVSEEPVLYARLGNPDSNGQVEIFNWAEMYKESPNIYGENAIPLVVNFPNEQNAYTAENLSLDDAHKMLTAFSELNGATFGSHYLDSILFEDTSFDSANPPNSKIENEKYNTENKFKNYLSEFMTENMFLDQYNGIAFYFYKTKNTGDYLYYNRYSEGVGIGVDDCINGGINEYNGEEYEVLHEGEQNGDTAEFYYYGDVGYDYGKITINFLKTDKGWKIDSVYTQVLKRFDIPLD